MGNYQNKEYVSMVQAQVVAGQQLESKLNYFGIVLIVITVILSLLLCYAIKRGCVGHARDWLRREVPLILSGATLQGQLGTTGNQTPTATKTGYV